MGPLDRATELLRQAETELRDLLSEAAKSGDYPSVLRIAAWARTLTELVNADRSGGRALGPVNPRVSGRTREQHGKAPKLSGAGTARPRGSDYPRFFRHGDELVRVAWSKREKKEYRHKASSTALKALAAVMAEKGTEGRMFSTDEFLPLRSGADGTEIPSYQVYVGISLFKQAGLIDQHGRQGYSIPRLADFKEAVEAVWKKLPQQ